MPSGPITACVRPTTFHITWDTNGPGRTLVVKDRPPYQVALVVKNLPANAGDQHSIPGLGRSPGEEMVAHLENSMDRGAWWATVHGVAKESEMTL